MSARHETAAGAHADGSAAAPRLHLNRPEAPALRVVEPALPKGGGAVKGMGEQFSADEFTGTAALSIPIEVTAGRGFAPALSLDYHSGSGNGPFGLGFSLGRPAIARRTSKGVPRYDDGDTFLYGGQALVPVASSRRDGWHIDRFQPRSEGAFDCIERRRRGPGEDHWVVQGSDGTTTLFGAGSHARIADPAHPAHIFEWLIEESVDAHGNHILYDYKAEDGAGLPEAERGRAGGAMRHLARIRYGNAHPVAGLVRLAAGPTPLDTPAAWHFEVVFDYGEYEVGEQCPDPYTPVRPWPCRRDRFSHFDAGFELRTLRLCRRVLLFHRFEEALGAVPVLVRAVAFDYREPGERPPAITLLTAITQIGFLRQEPGIEPPYATAALPPLRLDYTPFTPAGRPWEGLQQTDGAPLPGVDGSAGYQLVDLYGEGVPGLLYSDGTTLRYWRAAAPAEGRDARFHAPCEPEPFPIERQLAGALHALVDLEGDGQLDLLVTEPGRAGCYTALGEGRWSGFRPFAGFPADYHAGTLQHADLTGDGLADLVCIEEGRVRLYPARGRAGYGEPELHPGRPGLPPSRPESPRELLRFADMAGAGRPQLVRITDGEVTWWPSLGHGRFGDPVRMAGAPRLGEAFDATRLFLADLDGSGPADLIALFPDHLAIWFNDNGNAFSAEPLRLPLPERWDGLGNLGFADLHGTGSACLLLSLPHPAPRHRAYDFCGRSKPYLLDTIDNGMGAVTRIHYRSSTHFFLEDRDAGTPWLTPLPFPVQVVARVESIDQIANTRHVTRYRYRHGWYDGVEREFRGFGRVDRQESDGGAGDPAAAPTLVRTWYHTGWQPPVGELTDHYRREYWAADPEAMLPPATRFELAEGAADPATRREAHAALHGATLRSETYGLDGSPWAANPYTVSESGHRVRLIEPRRGGRHAVLLVAAEEAIHYDYERNPDDPRIGHEFVLASDRYGLVLRACTLAYPRRRPASDPQQALLRAVCEESGYIHLEEGPARRLGLPAESKRLELPPLAPDRGRYFSREGLAAQIEAALPAATLLAWQRHRYWDPAGGRELPPGAATAEALLHRSEAVEADPEQLAALFQGLLPRAELEALLTGRGPQEGGFVRYPADPESAARRWLWNPGGRQRYLGADRFFLPATFQDPFGHETTYGYDPHAVLVTAVTDPLGNRVTLEEIDYRTLTPRRLVDANGHRSETLIDPLGRVIAACDYGHEGEAPAGFDPIAAYRPRPAPAELDALLAAPGRHLQGAAEFWFYDPFAWVRRGTPPLAAHLAAESWPQGGRPGGGIRIEIAYADGFGRPLQGKLRLEGPGPALAADGAGGFAEVAAPERWLTSGAVQYNDRGLPVREYEPWFSTTPHYLAHPGMGVASTHRYDPLDRLIETQTPKGFLTRTLFGDLPLGPGFRPSPWHLLQLDENRTVKESPYWRAVFEEGRPVSEQERRSLEKAARCHGLPDRIHLDTLGRPVVSERQLLAPGADTAQWVTTRTTLDIDGHPLTSTDSRQHAAGRVNLAAEFTVGGQRVCSRSVDAGTHHLLANAAGQPIYARGPRGFETFTRYDPLHRPVARRLRGGDSGPAGQIIALTLYGDSRYRDPATGESRPLLPRPERWNARGRPVLAFDEAGLALSPHYDFRGQPLAGGRLLLEDYCETPDWSFVDEPLLGAVAAAVGSLAGPEALGQFRPPPALVRRFERAPFVAAQRRDALGRTVSSRDPGGNLTLFDYHATGALRSVQVTAGSCAPADGPTPAVRQIDYDAKGQRTAVHYGNDVVTRYAYEPESFRLARLTSHRPAGMGPQVVQDLLYHYDPVGNLTHIADLTAPTVTSGGRQAAGACDYHYDTLYRLVTATGREHPGGWNLDHRLGTPERVAGFAPQAAAAAADHGALQPYTQAFEYDLAGNLTCIRHQAANAAACRTRRFEVEPHSNRLRRSQTGSCAAGHLPGRDYTYDAAGNQLNLEGSAGLHWDHAERLRRVTLVEHEGGGADREYYLYDGSGQRLRKVTERRAAGALHLTETLYLDGFEVSRRRVLAATGERLLEQWHGLRLADGEHHPAEWRYQVAGEPPAGSAPSQVRYQLDDHLGSSVVELDAQARIITWESYYPHGGTAIFGGDPGEVARKRYRYSGKERDAATGLYYYGARYYCSWLGRWLSADPAGTVDGLNLYGFVGANPASLQDPWGLAAKKPKKQRTIGNKQPTGARKRRAPRRPQRPHGEYKRGMYHQRNKVRSELNKKLKRKNLEITGKTHEAEHVLGYDVLAWEQPEPSSKTNITKNLTRSEQPAIDNYGWAYHEIHALHRAHIGTGIGHESMKYRYWQRRLLESGEISSAVQLNQLYYTDMPEFQTGQGWDSKISDESFNIMATNMTQVIWHQNSKTMTTDVPALQRAEIFLSRQIARTGKWITEDDIKKVERLFKVKIARPANPDAMVTD